MARLLGRVELAYEILAIEEIANILFDNFVIIKKEDIKAWGYYRLWCESDYFDELEPGEQIPYYHVDLKRDTKTDELYIWRVVRCHT